MFADAITPESQLCRNGCSYRADGKLIKDKEAVYSFPQSEMPKNVTVVFAATQLLPFKLLCNVIYELTQRAGHPTCRRTEGMPVQEVVIQEHTKATKMCFFIMLLWPISESL